MSDFAKTLGTMFSTLPTWIKAAAWIALSGALTAIGNAVTTGQLKVSPEWMPIINIVIVFLAQFVNKEKAS